MDAMLGGVIHIHKHHIRGWTVAKVRKLLPHGGGNYIAKLVITRIIVVYGCLWFIYIYIYTHDTTIVLIRSV